jgi:crotonobetainyl-CoA:carnitine CoA-transferase CaiB-like acyl-CoA transferase
MAGADRPGPLAGVRLLSLAQNAPGPAAIAQLVAMSASAVKVEPPAGDPMAAMCPSWYEELHRGVEVHRVDLKTDAGLASLSQLASRSDVLLTSQRPSALARLGLDPASLRARQPSLRGVAIVGDTADPEVPGHDLTYLAQAGLLAGGMPLTLLADLLGATHAAMAVIAILREPSGTYWSVGLRDSLDHLLAPIRHGLTRPGGLLGGGNPAYGVYAARDGQIAVAALEPHFRARLYAALELPDGAQLAAVFAGRTASEWERWAAERDLPIAALR